MACCAFIANMRFASLDTICEASEVMSFHEIADCGDEVADGSGKPARPVLS